MKLVTTSQLVFAIQLRILGNKTIDCRVMPDNDTYVIPRLDRRIFKRLSENGSLFFVQEVSMLYFDLNDGKGVLFTDLTRIFERLVGEKTAFRVRSS